MTGGRDTMHNVDPVSESHRVRKFLLGLFAGTTLALLVGCGGNEADPPVVETQIATVPTMSTDSDGTTATSNATSAGTVVTTDPSTLPGSGSNPTQPRQTVAGPDQYLADAAALVSAVTAASDRVATQLEQADVESTNWRTETAAALRELAAVLNSADEFAAPPEYATQHQQLLDATSKYSWATDMLANGVVTLDLNTISDAAALLANASAEFAVAQAGLVG